MKTPVLFDVDGTLVASGELVMECYQATLDSFGAPRLAPKTLRSVVGPPLPVSFEQIAGLPVEDVPEAVRRYRALYAPRFLEPPLYEGIADLVRDLASAGVPLATATTKMEDMARDQLAHWDLLRHFDFVAGATPKFGASKAAVVGRALEALTNAGHSTAGTVLVGDRIYDVEGAASHAIGVIGAAWGYGTADEFDFPHVLTVAESPAELSQWLQS